MTELDNWLDEALYLHKREPNTRDSRSGLTDVAAKALITTKLLESELKGRIAEIKWGDYQVGEMGIFEARQLIQGED